MIDIGVDPVAFTIGTVSIRWYGIFIALAIIWLVGWMAWQSRRGARLTYDTVFAAALVGIPSGVIISRLLHVIDNIVVAKLHPELALAGVVIDYTQNPSQIIGAEGLTAYGAVLGASLGIWVYCRIAKVEIGYMFDRLAPGVIVAQAVIGRIGCTLNGCCHGVACSLPWAITYNDPASLGFGAGAVHPTQVYEIIFGLVGFVVLWKLIGRFKPAGSLYLIYLGLYSAWRVGIDFIRPGTPFIFELHQAQVIGIIVLLIVTPILVRRTRWIRTEEKLTQEEEQLTQEQEESNG
jgi:phosphatidylglycerol:prolipoprotein diacylglycerol transferase